MAQSFFKLATPVAITPSGAGAYVDVDVSAHIPAGATAAILHIAVTTSYNITIALRKNGSAYDKYYAVFKNQNLWAMVGLDANRIFEIKVSTVAYATIYLIGYTMTGVVMLDTPVEKAPAGLSAWEDLDCSVECPGAIGIIFDIIAGGGYNGGIRPNGSAEVTGIKSVVFYHSWVLSGCDASQIVEVYATDASVKFNIVGYITDGAILKSAYDDVSLGGTGSYIDIDCSAICPNAVFVFVLPIWNGSSTYTYGLRENGQTVGEAAIYKELRELTTAIVPCDASQIIEGKIADLGSDFDVIGYATLDLPSGSKGNSMAAKMLAGKMI